ncbi:MAG: hypothetical protein GX306_01660 [Clostridiales bacterium]|jgi:hypothetical protein|nr:hypothetical protein [Clostridiales bacterium]
MVLGYQESYDETEDMVCPFRSYIESVSDCGYYYLSPEICKDIIIVSGASGDCASNAIKKMRNNIHQIRNLMEHAIPALRFIDRNIISYYGSELAECLVMAAGVGKGIDITVGYPKVLIFKVS